MRLREALLWFVLLFFLIKDTVFLDLGNFASSSVSSGPVNHQTSSYHQYQSSVSSSLSCLTKDNVTTAYSMSLLSQSSKQDLIPRTIFIFWESGWDTAIPNAHLALSTWTLLNPEFTIVTLNATTAEQLTNRSQYIPDAIWSQTTVQARSDVYRTLLLNAHGGIWVDASLFCNKPLSSWLDLSDISDLFCFLRRGRKRYQRNMKLFPWVASWFLVSPPRGYMIDRIQTVMIQNPKRILSEYNWWHRIVSDLAFEDEYIFRHIAVNFPSNRPVVCNSENTPNFAIETPVMKRCEITNMATTFLISTQICCLSGNYTTPQQPSHSALALARASHATSSWHPEDVRRIQTTLCPRWNCHLLGKNFDAVDKLRRLMRDQARTLPSIDDPVFNKTKEKGEYTL